MVAYWVLPADDPGGDLEIDGVIRINAGQQFGIIPPPGGNWNANRDTTQIDFRFAPKTGHSEAYAELPLLPSRPGEFHPEPLTEPDVILSHHPAHAIARRLPPSAEQ